ncbi:glycosyltransferase [Dyella sp. M7H15-1]|uniref:glycosyltransferase n=1 Tax=Dyella sp. M7H15-1 TaxID=2501295 RepID=UPI001004D90F|nr:glycosyltransferase [Dyella sp. M7H15-1]QAU24985.1 glycosyltransferase [Dyella sp. M7H15-1]
MKIVLDLQGAQSNSRHRGIGRYTVSMARAFAEEAAKTHELWLALNGRHDCSALDLIEDFSDLIPRNRVLINELPANIAGCLEANRERMLVAEVARASFFDQIDADCIWHSSMFEGWGDDSSASLGSGTDDYRHAATLYDLIPLIHPGRYLHDSKYKHWYYRRLGLLKRCGLLLAISESSRREAIDFLGIPPDRVAVVSAAVSGAFAPTFADETVWARWHQQYGITRGYVLYVGGYDVHKNVDGLLTAYADLPPSLRERHPLVLAGRCDEQVKRFLVNQAGRLRLKHSGVIFTEEIDDAELALLYSNCEVFVTPSLHEGFGLPVLEAMSCGAAVVGSNTASLPEVIGCEDALFDPRSPSSMAHKLQQVLTDADMRKQLREHAVKQVAQFSWAGCAQKALAAIEQHVERSPKKLVRTLRPRLIYVSPLPPARSGIADYSARLLRDLASHYDIEVVADQPEVLDPWVQANFPFHSVDWLRKFSDLEARVLYHMGNSPVHAFMFELMRQTPGVVMLHDFFMGGVRNWMDSFPSARRNWTVPHSKDGFRQILFEHHGYGALLHDMRQGRRSTIDTYPVNLDVLDRALGILAHSHHAIDLARWHWGEQIAGKFKVVPFPKALSRRDRREARRLLAVGPDEFVVCSFGLLAPTKLNHRLLEAWFKSSLVNDSRCHLIFVGENDGGEYGKNIVATIEKASSSKRIRITGFVDEDRYMDYVAAADIAVQLRTASRGETSAAIFDALAQGVPLIANAHGSIDELPDDALFKLDDEFSEEDLAAALDTLRGDDSLRQRFVTRSSEWLQRHHHPVVAVERYRDAIEQFSGHGVKALNEHALAVLQRNADSPKQGERMRRMGYDWMARNRPRPDKPRLFVDVTATSSSKLHTGIERVVRGVLTQLLSANGLSWRIEPVRLVDGKFVQALPYTQHLLELSPIAGEGSEVHPHAGDVFLGLDWVADVLPANTALLDAWRACGVKMLFVVYDLLPVRMPHHFPDFISPMHASWLQCIGHYADALVGISKAVIEDLRDWYDDHPPERRTPLELGYFYPGNDPAATRPTLGLPKEASRLLRRLTDTPSFLMIGTVEPRKGHAFVLDAFERFWASGGLANLVIVGRHGWMSDALGERLRARAASDARLIWIEQASDEYLEQLYGVARALIAASEGEGFGLPLVEAARRGLPVIARDIPVFREVSDGLAYYFDGHDADSLVDILGVVLTSEKFAQAREPSSSLSWKATTSRLCELISHGRHEQWLAPWVPMRERG